MHDKNLKYGKGYDDNRTHCIFSILPEPQHDPLRDEPYQVIVKSLNDGSLDRIELEEFEKRITSIRWISLEEYEFLICVADLQREIFYNQYTGGFPREGTVKGLMDTMRMKVGRTLRRMADREEGGDANAVGT